MDPLTQGLIGATAARSSVSSDLPKAGWIGLLAGMFPDLDIFIKSEADPLLAVEYHRHFTHALAFVPIGGILCALPWLLIPRLRTRWREVLLASTAAIGTHGLLDSATTYGTQLLWPFSNYRVAWDWISIIDPLFTLALLLALIFAHLRKSRRLAIAGLAFAVAYLVLGAWQNQQALDAQAKIASLRGHTVERGQAFPTIGNLLVWRSLYESDGQFFSDRIRISLTGEILWTEGQQVQRIRLDNLPAPWANDPVARQDFQRFAWFSDQWVAASETDPELYGDARYSLQTAAYDPIWGIRFSHQEERPTEWVSRTRERKLNWPKLWQEIRGTDPAYQPIPPH
jgi:inner membrane protein